MIEVIAQHWTALSFLAGTIILGLLGYLILILHKIKKQTRDKKEKIDSFRSTCLESIQTIVAATMQQQCNLSEAALRIAAIIDTLNQHYPSNLDFNNYPQLSRLYGAVKDHPILSARKKLPRNERMKLDLSRETLEAELESDILKELETLRADILHILPPSK